MKAQRSVLELQINNLFLICFVLPVHCLQRKYLGPKCIENRNCFFRCWRSTLLQTVIEKCLSAAHKTTQRLFSIYLFIYFYLFFIAENINMWNLCLLSSRLIFCFFCFLRVKLIYFCYKLCHSTTGPLSVEFQTRDLFVLFVLMIVSLHFRKQCMTETK